nr:MAG TPA: Inner kinetochore subunit IML3, Inner kinetochore, DNA, nucleosome, DNA.15A [Caudoviricetes sp.]
MSIYVPERGRPVGLAFIYHSLTYKWLRSDWTLHDCIATYILGKL